jgi:Na+/phosphate symporter
MRVLSTITFAPLSFASSHTSLRSTRSRVGLVGVSSSRTFAPLLSTPSVSSLLLGSNIITSIPSLGRRFLARL